VVHITQGSKRSIKNNIIRFNGSGICQAMSQERRICKYDDNHLDFSAEKGDSTVVSFFRPGKNARFLVILEA